MKTAQMVSSEKLRGGFYTPPELVDVCLDRVLGHTKRNELRVLEPSLGDGAFLTRLASHELGGHISQFVGIEINEIEALKAGNRSSKSSFDTCIAAESFLRWMQTNDATFDIAIGNPPFVRYQFIDEDEGERIHALSRTLGVPMRGVSNLWIPILLGALSRLRPGGGSMAFVVPAEIFTGVSGGVVRSWLLRNFASLRVDLFAPGSFPSVLQEVVVISEAAREISQYRRYGKARLH